MSASPAPDAEILQALLDHLGSALLVEDAERRILRVNRDFCRLFSIPVEPEVLIGIGVDSALREIARRMADPAGFVGRLEELRRSSAPVAGELVTMADGRVLERDSIPIRIAGAPRGHLWQYRDVTARQRAAASLVERGNQLSAANAELARAARLKDEFLAAMSHELRTPLHAVLGLSEALRDGVFGALTAQQLEPLANIEDSGRHLLQLINDILDLSKVEAGRLELVPDELDVATVAAGCLRMVREAAQKKNLRVELDVDPSAETIQADPTRLKQILVNLLSNAVKFTPEGGTVGLTVTRDAVAGVLRFVVHDTGVGIAAADLPRLFRPFVQLDSKLTRQHAGTGLGLCLVRRLAELHGGGVELESTVGKGSRFTVSLPAPAAQPSPPPPVATLAAATTTPASATAAGGRAPASTAPGVARPASGPLVLLAEDHEINVKTIERFLTLHGYRIALARNGHEAIERALEDRPKLILMDIQMPEMDGLEAIRVLRARQETVDVPIIALTALAMPGDREVCLAAGADAYLSKPAPLDELASTMAWLLASGRKAHGDS